MQSDNRFLDDIARLATGALGALNGARQEVDQLMRQRIERWLADMDLVPRDEFEAVKAMAARAREENERLAERLAALEARLARPRAKAAPVQVTPAKVAAKPRAAARKSPLKTASPRSTRPAKG